MVASVYTGRLVDTGDPGYLQGAIVVGTGYVPGEILPPEAASYAPPTVTLVSPPAGTPIRAGDALVYLVASATPIFLTAARVRIGTQLPLEQQTREAAYDRDDPAGAWDPRYAGSSVEQLSPTQWRVTLRRASWPGGGIGLLPRVTNAGGAAP